MEKKTTTKKSTSKRGRKPRVTQVDTSELVNGLKPVEDVMSEETSPVDEKSVFDQVVDDVDFDDEDDSLSALFDAPKEEEVVLPAEEPGEEAHAAEEDGVVEDACQENLGRKETAALLVKDLDHEVKNNVSEEDTNAMLNYLKMQSIPNIVNNDVWVRAIAKVLKRDTTVSWCVMKRINANDTYIEKVFGTCSAIVKTGTPIPIETVPPYIIKSFESGDLKSRREFLLANFKVDANKVFQYTERQLDIEIMRLQIKRYGETRRR